MANKFKNLIDIKGYHEFVRGSHNVLIHTLSDLLSAKVDLDFEPIEKYLKIYGIDIVEKPKRTTYFSSNMNQVYIISYAEMNDSIYILGTTLTSPLLKYLDKKLFHNISNAITKSLCDATYKNFRNCMDMFGEQLVIQIISKITSVGYYNRSKISYILNLFKNLRSTTFEGEYFSTGLILTKSIYSYKKNDDQGKFIILPKEQSHRLYDDLGRRFWFLADGLGTFFISDLSSSINAIYLHNRLNDYVSDTLLESRLLGGDLLIRVLNGRELSVINSKGHEFVHQENVWKYRDLKALKKCLNNYIEINDQLFNSIMKYVLRFSRADRSSILWVVSDENKILRLVTNTELNRITRVFVDDRDEKLNINSPSIEPLVDRLLASDGATVINLKGDILYYGVFADLSQNPLSGVKGSGETAASILGKNGLAIKVSQDGPITIYVEGTNESFSF